MAEAIALASSITGLIQAAKELIDAYNRHTHAVEEAKDLIVQVQRSANRMKNVIDDVQKVGNTGRVESESLKRVLKSDGDLQKCRDTIVQLQGILEQRLHAIDQASGLCEKSMSWVRKWDTSWTKQAKRLSDKVDEYRDSIREALDMEQAQRDAPHRHKPLGTKREVDLAFRRPYSKESMQGLRDWRRKIADWLTPKDYSNAHKLYCSKRIEGTSGWVMESTQFKEWQQNKAAVLSCQGPPGAGKTYITAAVIEHLDNQVQEIPTAKVGLTYLYFNYNDEDSDHDAQALLSNLLGQLVRSLPGEAEMPKPPSLLESLYEKRGRRGSHRGPSLKDISKAMHEVASHYDHTFIVIDALDECRSVAQRDELLSQLWELRSELDLRVFTTSRAGEKIPESRGTKLLELSILAQNADIQVFVDRKIPELTVVRDNRNIRNLAGRVKDSIVKKSEGIFLLARMYLDRLKRLHTVSDVEKELEDVKSGKNTDDTLRLVYDNEMDKIDDYLARGALKWTAFATRGLSETELRHALAMLLRTADSGSAPDERLGISEDDLPNIKSVIQACHGLLEVNPRTRMVSLAHRTTKTYLQKAAKSRPWLQSAEGDIANSCIAYIRLKAFARGPFSGICWYDRAPLDAFLADFPLMGYASSNWAGHLSRSADRDLKRPLQDVCEFEDNLLLSFQIHSLANHQSFADGICAKHIVSSLGEGRLMRALKDLDLQAGRGFDRNAMDRFGRTAMHYAVARADGKAQEMVKTLLDLRFDRNAVDNEGQTPLHIAARSGDVETTKLLLQHKADTEVMMGACDATPLIEACCSGQVETVKELLKARANVNARSPKLGTPLEAAILGLSSACVEELLRDKRLKKNTPTAFGTALHDAAYRGDPEIVKQLLDAHFDANEAEPRGTQSRGTPLQVAIVGDDALAGEGRDAFGVVQMLLDHGADVNRSSSFGTALDTARDLERKELEQLLLERGAVPSEDDSRSKMIPYVEASQLAVSTNPLESQRIPEAHRDRLRQFLVAVMMKNERLVQEHSRTRILAFHTAIRERKETAVRRLAQLSMLEFEAMVDLAKLKHEEGEANGERKPWQRYSWIYKLTVKLAVRTSHLGATILGWSLGIQNTKLEGPKDLKATVHGIEAAGSALKIMTNACVEILSDAIEFGDGDLVQLIAKYWTACLLRIFLAGEAGEPLLNNMVDYRAQQMEACFREKTTEKAILLAEVGLELMAAALQLEAQEVQGSERLKYVFTKIWSLALRRAVDSGHATHEDMEDFFYKNADAKLRHCFDSGSWQPYKRLGAAVIETLSGIVADGDICLALSYARSVARDMDDALRRGGWAQLVNGVIFRHLRDRLWRSIGKAGGLQETLGPEVVLESKEKLPDSEVSIVVGTTLNLFHAAVRYNYNDVVARLEELVVTNLDRLRRDGEMVGSVLCLQLREYIPAWCQIDKTPLYCFKTWQALWSAVKRTEDTKLKNAFHHELVGILTEDSRELDFLRAEIATVLTSTNSQDTGEDMKGVVIQLGSALGVELKQLLEVKAGPSEGKLARLTNTVSG